MQQTINRISTNKSTTSTSSSNKNTSTTQPVGAGASSSSNQANVSAPISSPQTNQTNNTVLQKSNINPSVLLHNPVAFMDFIKQKFKEKQQTDRITRLNDVPYSNEHVYTASSAPYNTAQATLSNQLTTANKEVTEGTNWLNDYIKVRGQYQQTNQSYLNQINMLTNATPTDKFWIDINKDNIQDTNEIFSRNETLTKTKNEYTDFYTKYQDYEKTYKELPGQIVDIKINTIPDINYSIAALSTYQSKGYNLNLTDNGYTFSIPGAKEQLEQIYGSDKLNNMVIGEEARSLGIGWVVGKIGDFLLSNPGQHEADVYQSILSDVPYRNEPIVAKGSSTNFGISSPIITSVVSQIVPGGEKSATGRFWTSPKTITTVYLPIAFAGLGYLTAGLSAPGELFGEGSSLLAQKLSSFGTTFPGKLLNTGIKTSMYAAGGAMTVIGGVQLGTIAAKNPEQLPSAIGGMVSGAVFMSGGLYLGAKMFGGNVPKLSLDASGKPLSYTEITRTPLFKETSTGDILYKNIYNSKTTLIGKEPGTGIIVRGQGRGYGVIKDLGTGDTYISKELVYTRPNNYSLFKPEWKMWNTGEAYGISDIMFQGDNFAISLDRGAAAIYGKNPNVITSKGMSLSFEGEPGSYIKNIYEPSGLKPRFIDIDFNMVTSSELARISGNPKYVGMARTVFDEFGNVTNRAIFVSKNTVFNKEFSLWTKSSAKVTFQHELLHSVYNLPESIVGILEKLPLPKVTDFVNKNFNLLLEGGGTNKTFSTRIGYRSGYEWVGKNENLIKTRITNYDTSYNMSAGIYDSYLTSGTYQAKGIGFKITDITEILPAGKFNVKPIRNMIEYNRSVNVNEGLMGGTILEQANILQTETIGGFGGGGQHQVLVPTSELKYGFNPVLIIPQSENRLKTTNVSPFVSSFRTSFFNMETIQTPRIMQIQNQNLKQIVSPTVSQVQIQNLEMKQVQKLALSQASVSLFEQTSFGGLMLPGFPALHGGNASPMKYNDWMRFYRKREFKVLDIREMFGMKITKGNRRNR